MLPSRVPFAMLVTFAAMLAACSHAEVRPAARAAARCAGEPGSCQELVDRHLHDLGRAPGLTKELAAACRPGASDVCWAYATFLADGAGVTRDVAKARGQLETACRGGHAPSCRGVASMTFEGVGGAADPEAALAGWRAACDAGDGRACVEYAGGWKRLGRTLTPDDAMARLAKACTAGEARACGRLGFALADERGGDANEARGLELARGACAAGSAEGCVLAVRIQIDDLQRGWERGEVRATLADGCERGVVWACVALGSKAEEDAHLRPLCAGGDLEACTEVASHRLARSDRAALPLLRAGCARSRGIDCGYLGAAYADGIGVSPDAKAAFTHFTRACALGDHQGCYDASAAYYTGEGAPQDDAPGDRVLDESCARGMAESCLYLASVREQDGDRRTVSAYERACTAGSAEACKRVVELHHDLKHPAAQSLPWERRACAPRVASACARVAWLGWVKQEGVGDDEGAHAAGRGCVRGSAEACHLTALFVAAGRGIEKSAEKALVLERLACEHDVGAACGVVAIDAFGRRLAPLAAAAAQRACELGNSYGCRLLAWLTVLGEGVAQDEASALTLFKHACALGDASCCGQASSMMSRGLGGPVDDKGAHDVVRGCLQAGTCFAGVEQKPKPRGPFAKQSGTCTAAAWIDLPAGTTTMRWSLDVPDERAAVTLSAFRMRATPVTQCQYLACVKAKKCSPPDVARMSSSEAAMAPVTGVDFAQAAAYCGWEGGRLPSEAEWVYAAQGSAEPAYPWGDEKPECVEKQQSCWTELTEVGTSPFDVSASGVRDLGALVAEWTGDWFARWPGDAPANPSGPPSGQSRVVRGGDVTLAVVRRARRRPDDRGRHLGFRCVKAAGAK